MAWRLTPRAERDLDDIWEYSAKRWSNSQAEAYVRSLTEVFAVLAAAPKMGQQAGHIRSGYRRHRVGSHVVFYRTLTAHIEIVRVLHKNMNLEQLIGDLGNENK